MSLDFSKLKKLNIEGIDLKKLIIGQYNNLVPTSIDTDNSIFNGCGYVDDYRLSSSGALKTQSGTITTGFIPYTQNCIITIIGTDFLLKRFPNVTYYHYIMFYDKNFTKLGYYQLDFSPAGGYVAATSGSPTVNINNSIVSCDKYGITTIKILFNTSSSNIAYFRINAYGQGSNMIVATSITDIKFYNWKRALVNLVSTSIDIDGNIYNECGYITGYTLSEEGTLTQQSDTITTGYISAKNTDIIKMSGIDWMNPPANSVYYICFYDENFVYLGSAYHSGSAPNDRGYTGAHEKVDVVENNNSQVHNIKTDSNGVTTVNIRYNTNVSFKYIRISAGYIGQEMIVTKNEEII